MDDIMNEITQEISEAYMREKLAGTLPKYAAMREQRSKSGVTTYSDWRCLNPLNEQQWLDLGSEIHIETIKEYAKRYKEQNL